MESLTIQTTDSEAAIRLIRSSLLKEAAFLRLGIEKTTLTLVEWEGEIEVLYRLEENVKQIDELKVCK